jgi:hypothetical protein
LLRIRQQIMGFDKFRNALGLSIAVRIEILFQNGL